MKKLLSLLLTVMLVFSLAVPASAASVTFEGRGRFTIKSGGTYTATDLFGEDFKNLMPGDRVSQQITIKGGFLFGENTLRVYLRAIPHTSSDNKPVVEEIKDVEKMYDFLNQLTLRVYNESKKDALIFEGKAGELDGLKNDVQLGEFRASGKIKLRVELEVPKEMGNEFANQVGEIDWVFTVEGLDDPAYNPRTGDYILMAVAVMAVSGAALAGMLALKRKKKQ